MAATAAAGARELWQQGRSSARLSLAAVLGWKCSTFSLRVRERDRQRGVRRTGKEEEGEGGRQAGRCPQHVASDASYGLFLPEKASSLLSLPLSPSAFLHETRGAAPQSQPLFLTHLPPTLFTLDSISSVSLPTPSLAHPSFLLSTHLSVAATPDSFLPIISSFVRTSSVALSVAPASQPLTVRPPLERESHETLR